MTSDICTLCYELKQYTHQTSSGDRICKDCLTELNLSPDTVKIYSIFVTCNYPSEKFSTSHDIADFLLNLRVDGLYFENSCLTLATMELKLKFKAVGDNIDSVELKLYEGLGKLNGMFPEFSFESPYIEEKC